MTNAQAAGPAPLPTPLTDEQAEGMYDMGEYTIEQRKVDHRNLLAMAHGIQNSRRFE